MHLAAFVDDVSAADHDLTLYAEGSGARLQSELARSLPAAPVTVEPTAGSRPASLGRLDQDTVALSLTTSREGRHLTLAPDLAVTGAVVADDEALQHLAAVDETTFAMPAVSEAVLDAATRAVAGLADVTAGGTFHAGVGPLSRLGDGAAGAAVQAAGAADTNVHVYGAPDDEASAAGPVAVHGLGTGELPDARFAVHDGAGTDARKAAVLAVPDGEHYRGFLTLRSRLVDDLTAYLERTYGRERDVGTPARGT